MKKQEKQDKKKTPKKSKIKGIENLKNPQIYLDLIEWIAMPTPLREPKTQGEFAKEHNIGEDSISAMKQRDGFWEEVRNKRREWGKERTPNVILGLYKKAVLDGNAGEVKLWLQVFEEFAEKQETKLTGELSVLLQEIEDGKK